jgi:hypothetical protein
VTSVDISLLNKVRYNEQCIQYVTKICRQQKLIICGTGLQCNNEQKKFEFTVYDHCKGYKMGLQCINENCVYSVELISNKCKYEPLEKLKWREGNQQK